MRIAEIAVLGPSIECKQLFIKSVCRDVPVDTDSVIFGRLPVNDDLVLHLYGLDFMEKAINPSWDLVARKLLGHVVLFDWFSPKAYAAAKSTIDALTWRFRTPLVIAAVVRNGPYPVPAELMKADFSLADQELFTFCNISEAESVSQVLVILMNSLLSH